MKIEIDIPEEKTKNLEKNNVKIISNYNFELLKFLENHKIEFEVWYPMDIRDKGII